MKILFLANNRIAWNILEWLIAQGEELAGLVVHPAEKCKYGKELIEASNLDPCRVFDGSHLGTPDVFRAIADLRADIAVSVCFGYILKPAFLELFPRGCVNLHTSLLPYNRGANPNVWTIVDRTPAGVTLHYVDEGVDTGDVIRQRSVDISPADTGETLYRRLEEESLRLFQEAWPDLRSGTATRTPQPAAAGRAHRVRDLEVLDRIDADRNYRGRELIDILRARTFPPYRGSYFEENGRRYYMRLEIEDAGEN